MAQRGSVNNKKSLTIVLVYHVFLNAICFVQERSSRQLFTLRRQLATQFRVTQRAQVAEKYASDMKKRFVSYSEESDLARC